MTRPTMAERDERRRAIFAAEADLNICTILERHPFRTVRDLQTYAGLSAQEVRDALKRLRAAGKVTGRREKSVGKSFYVYMLVAAPAPAAKFCGSCGRVLDDEGKCRSGCSDAPGTMGMAEQLLARLNDMEAILSRAETWAPDPERLADNGGSVAMAWLVDQPVAHAEAAKFLQLSEHGAIRFGFAWGYIEACADACDQTIGELLDGVGIEPLPSGGLVRRAG